MDEAAQILRQSVQEDEVTLTQGLSSSWLSMMGPTPGQVLDPWGTARRQRQLRNMYYDDRNSMVTSAIQQLVRRVKQTPWTIVGGPNLTRRYQHLMQESDFGDGVDTLVSKLLTDYYTLDVGAFMEVVGPGDPDTPLTQPPIGLVALDALRCYPTGNREFPVFYRSHRTNTLHKLHWTRVQRLVDMPSPDPFYRGLGLCALSRAAIVAQAQMMLMQFEIDNLTDQPVNGILTMSGISASKLNGALQMFADNREQGAIAPMMRNLLQLTSTDPASPVTVTLTPFSQLPNGYTPDEVVRNHVNLIALAIGVDPQDIWPLASKSMGSGLQSEILHAKGQGKTFGDTLSMLTRVFNVSVLPRSLELRFKPRDGEREKQDADTAAAWVGTAAAAVSALLMSPAQGAALLANNVDAFADVLLDEAGNLRVNDQDIKPTGAEAPTNPANPSDSIAPSNSPNTTTTTGGTATGSDLKPTVGAKSLQATRLDFEGDLEDLLSSAMKGDVTRRRFGVVLRALIARYGRAAFKDGLEVGGVQPQDMSTDDDKTVLQLLQAQSVYVTGLGDALFDSRSLTEAAAAQKPAVWFNKSINPFYEAGLVSADRNGYYGWVLGNTIEHCTNCVDFADNHVHRLKDWIRAGWQPKSLRLECKGFNCDCRYVKTDGPAMGRFKKSREAVHVHE